MNFIDRLLGRKAAQLTYDQVADLIDGVGGGIVAGVAVNEKTALQVSTVLACVKAIADGCATPPMHVYREMPNGTRQKAVNIPEYRLLARRPNDFQTSFEWRRQMTLHAALTGSGLSIKVRGGNGRVSELLPVEPGRWDVRRDTRYRLIYRCYDEFGLIGEFGPDDVFIINGLQWDWHQSMNALTLAKAAIGLSIATERSQSAMHANGLKAGGVYSVEGALNAEQHERLSAFLKRKTGADNAGAPLILDRSAKWQNTSITGVDAQHVETRRLQIEEVCRAYGVFPIMVGHSDKSATFASSEAFFAAHVKHTLAPWHRAWCQRIDEMLLDGSGPLFAEFDTRYMTSGSMVDRAQWARTMVEMGVYTRNEIRDSEGLDPIEGLDDPLTPMNMTQGEPEPVAPVKDEAQEKHFADLERKLDALATRQTPAQPVIVNNHLPEQKHTTNITNQASAPMPAPDVVVNNTFAAPENNVSIEAIMPEQKAAELAPITVINQVQPAEVVVNNAFASKAVQTVQRDDNDEIISTTTRYES